MPSHAQKNPTSADRDSDPHLILHMRQNRSHLTQKARLCVSLIALLFMLMSLSAGMEGQWLVPAFSILAMAGLTFALERHAKSRPDCETLEFDKGHIRHRDSMGRVAEHPACWMRLATESRSNAELRLFLRTGDVGIEFGRCLSIDEKREILPLVAAALTKAKGR